MTFFSSFMKPHLIRPPSITLHVATPDMHTLPHSATTSSHYDKAITTHNTTSYHATTITTLYCPQLVLTTLLLLSNNIISDWSLTLVGSQPPAVHSSWHHQAIDIKSPSMTARAEILGFLLGFVCRRHMNTFSLCKQAKYRNGSLSAHVSGSRARIYQ
jgi:hypothetical protein